MSTGGEARGFGEHDAARIARAVLWHERQAHNEQRLRGATPAGDEQLAPLVYNDSGETIPPYAIMRHDSEVKDQDNLLLFIKVKKPDTTWGSYLVNGPNPIESAALGRAQGTRYGRLAYDTGTPAKDQGYGPKPSQWTASKGYPCLAVSQGIVQSDSKWVDVQHIPLLNFLGKTEVSVSAGASLSGAVAGAYKIYGGTKGSEVDGGWTTVPSVYFRNALASGKWFRATWLNDGWEGEPLTC